jgi:hypothetical protein
MAASADYCITCKNPDATYRCKVRGVSKRAGDAVKLFCVIRTAKEGNHASCSAEAASAGCNGVVKVYNYNGPSLPDDMLSDPRVKELKQKVEQDRRTFEEPEGDEPKTLFELGGRAAKASARGLRNAGSAVGLTSPAGETAPPSTASLPKEAEAEESVGTVTRVRQAAQSAGSAVGGFAKKSYRCVVSLFSNCRGE